MLFMAFLAAGRSFFHLYVASFTSFAMSKFLAETLDFTGTFFVTFFAISYCLVCLVVELDVLFHFDHVSSKGGPSKSDECKHGNNEFLHSILLRIIFLNHLQCIMNICQDKIVYNYAVWRLESLRSTSCSIS